MTYLPNELFKLEHWQVPGDRHSYLVGLAADCFLRPNDDRNSHYFARELFWSGRYKSALKEFQRHVTMNGWETERAESMIYIGDCYGHLNRPQDQVEWYQKAYNLDGGRRKALLKLAQAYKFWNDPQRTAVYASGALTIPRNGYYANDMREYTVLPHELLYWAKGWMGDIAGAKEHLFKCLEYEPYNPVYADATKYYCEYKESGIEGWMTPIDCEYLYNTAKMVGEAIEVGSWKGRSTHALLSGVAKAGNGTVIAIDTWAGSKDPQDLTNSMAKTEDIYATFMKNVGSFPNLKTIRKFSVDAAKDFEDGSIPFFFLDAGHSEEEVTEDIKAWLPKIKKGGIFAGDDYLPNTWMGVCEAVRKAFGGPDEIHGKIWVHHVK